MSQAQAEPCRWHSDRRRKILSKPCAYVCVSVWERGGGGLMRRVNRCTDQLVYFQNTTLCKEGFSSFLLSVFRSGISCCERDIKSKTEDLCF